MSNEEKIATIEATETARLAVVAAKEAMEAGHYHTPLREAYEAAVATHEALSAIVRAF